MIKIESVYIEETRGIRKLELRPDQKNFSISGPNGSGKSGVVDAIEFGLTGDIKRLAGSGTKGLSVSEHGPHVDKIKFPDASFVELRVHLPTIGKSVTIKRSIKKPKAPEVVPDEPDVIAVLKDIAAHPEITLSRRDIIRFILVGPTERSKEIQTLLKLDELGDTRRTLNTAQNNLKRAHTSAETQRDSAKKQLILHLQIDQLSSKELLEVVNKNRKTLNLDSIPELTPQTQLDLGLIAQDGKNNFNKASSVKSIETMNELMAKLDDMGKAESDFIVNSISQLQQDAALLTMIQQRSLVEKGLELVEGPDCPLCDHTWPDEEHLKAHITVKIDKSKEAGQLTKRLLDTASNLAKHVTEISANLTTVYQIASLKEISAAEDAKVIEAWRKDLNEFKNSLNSVEKIILLKDRLESDWLNVPAKLEDNINNIGQIVNAKPDQSAIVAAQTFLTTAQVRLSDYRKAMQKHEQAEKSASCSKLAYDIYCKVMEAELTALYEEVQEDFSTYYRELNQDDEDSFRAKFTPTEGALSLDVNFYERGLFPPGAYHSEGHQDGMGVCLYLALMKRLFGEKFSFALLDDVVMSVDSGHRYQFCKLLQAKFPDTQFILTTHDRLWAKQMNSAKLVSSKNSLVFHSWSVDTGPLVESSEEIWVDIDKALDEGKVEAAAHSLRRHLEYFANHQCDQLGAHPQFRADGNYDLGVLLPAAQKRMKDILGKAASAAHSWGDDETKNKAQKLKETLSQSSGAVTVEQWAINPAVHYNEWANFGKTDFIPVVQAFKELVDSFECPTCNSWLHVAPRFKPESLRCICGAINFNMNLKPK